jgi:hypothetical protein
MEEEPSTMTINLGKTKVLRYERQGTKDPGSIATFIRKTMQVRNDPDVAAQVPCGGCTACCRDPKLILTLTPDEAKRLRSHSDPHDRGEYAIDRDPDTGTCVYLIDDRCSIYTERPKACRKYDCRLHKLGAPLPYVEGPVVEAAKSWAPFKVSSTEERVMLFKFALWIVQVFKGRTVDFDKCNRLAIGLVAIMGHIPAEDFHSAVMEFVLGMPESMSQSLCRKEQSQ